MSLSFLIFSLFQQAFRASRHLAASVHGAVWIGIDSEARFNVLIDTA